MGYLDEIARDVRALIQGGDVETVVDWVKEKILESYRNGQAAGPKAGKSDRSPTPVTKWKPRAPHHGN